MREPKLRAGQGILGCALGRRPVRTSHHGLRTAVRGARPQQQGSSSTTTCRERRVGKGQGATVGGGGCGGRGGERARCRKQPFCWWQRGRGITLCTKFHALGWWPRASAGRCSLAASASQGTSAQWTEKGQPRGQGSLLNRTNGQPSSSLLSGLNKAANIGSPVHARTLALPNAAPLPHLAAPVHH